MADRILTDKLKSEALNSGMDLIGFAPVSRWKNAPFLLSPNSVLPSAKSVIVTGIHITDAWTEYGGEPEPHIMGPGGWMDQNSFLDRIAFKIVKFLRSYGFEAIAVASSNIWRYRTFEGIDSNFAPDLSHIHASCAAGISQIGWTGLAITPEFGPRVRFISIVTNAKLVDSPMYSGPDLCDQCMHCVSCCPSKAMKKDFNGKPHVVEIGGKTFRYANKNIWRCAWAEHFELNLRSDTLDNDHIDETTILNEINTCGKSGHERGVCQKICIPPHLRSNNNSSAKRYAMNRINKKYPDSMPTLRKLRDDITAFSIANGIELTQCKPLDKSTKLYEGINNEIENMETVFAFAFRVPKEFKSISKNSPEYTVYNYAIRQKMHHILLKISRFIEDCGYYSASYTADDLNTNNLKKYIDNKDFNVMETGWGETKHACMAYALAEMAGIGTIEKRFVSYEFGEDVAVGAIITDAKLDPTPGCTDISPVTLQNKRIMNLNSYIMNIAENNMVDLFGVASASSLECAAKDIKNNIDESELGIHVIDDSACIHGKWNSKIVKDNIKISSPTDYIKDAKNVIVLGMGLGKELINNSGNDKTKQIGTYGYATFQTIFELRFAALEIATALNELGYDTYITDDLLKIGSRMDSPRNELPDFRCGAIEAVAAGLGEIGKSGALLTPEFGAHQKLISIVTNAPLTVSEPYSGDKLCKNCDSCICTCTTNAINKDEFTINLDNQTIKYPVINRLRCDWAKRYSLSKKEGPELIGNNTDIPIPDGNITIEDIAKACELKDQIMKKRTVILEPCLKNCKA